MYCSDRGQVYGNGSIYMREVEAPIAARCPSASRSDAPSFDGRPMRHLLMRELLTT